MAAGSFEGLCVGFCEIISVSPPALCEDAQGLVAFNVVWRGVTVNLVHCPQTSPDHIFAVFELGPLEPSGSRSLADMQTLLEANFVLLRVHAPAFSRNPATGHAVLQYVYSLFRRHAPRALSTDRRGRRLGFAMAREALFTRGGRYANHRGERLLDGHAQLCVTVPFNSSRSEKMISSSSPRGRGITQDSPPTQGDDPARPAEAPQGKLQIQAGLASNNVNPSEQASAYAAARATPAGEATARSGLAPSAATLNLPSAGSPHEKGSVKSLRTQSEMGLQNFTRGRSPSSRSAPRNVLVPVAHRQPARGRITQFALGG